MNALCATDNKKAGPATSAQSAGDALASATAASLKRSGQSKASGIDGSKAGHSSVSDDMPGAKLEAAATGSLNTSEGAAMDRSGKGKLTMSALSASRQHSILSMCLHSGVL